MQCCKLPIRVSERIDKLTRDYLWGSNDERRRMHMVGWDKVTNPTCIGGLGLFKVKARNDAILAKLCWRIASTPDAAWSQMLCKKYLTPARLNDRGRKYPASRTWKACKIGGLIFNKGLKWVISNGEG
nr:putative ribonuclease h protein [Quercus suber]